MLDLIEKTPKGLLVMLDEEINVPRGTDVTFMNKVKRLHSKHPNFVVPKIRTALP